MKSLKRVGGALLAGFLLFAPPGTLVVVALLVLGLFGNVWGAAGLVIGFVSLLGGLLYRRSLARRSRL